MNRLLSIILFLVAAVCAAHADPWIDELVSVNFGSPADPFFVDPDVIFGPPTGSTPGISGSLDVLNIGVGGEIIVKFTNNILVDGPGPDFTIFENPFYRTDTGGSPEFEKVFSEPAYVSVSDTGTTWVTFQTDYTGPFPLPGGTHPDPAWFSGFAGIQPVFSSPSNGIDPLDPLVSGGDVFDLADVAVEAAALGINLQNIQFIRITDVIVGTGTDSGGDTIPAAPAAVNGFDLDAIAALNSISYTAADDDLWVQYD